MTSSNSSAPRAGSGSGTGLGRRLDLRHLAPSARRSARPRRRRAAARHRPRSARRTRRRRSPPVMTKAATVPPLSAPCETSIAAWRIIRVIEPNSSVMTIAVSNARSRIRRRAVAKARVDRLAEAAALARLLAEGLDDLHRAQRLGDDRAEIGDPVLAAARDVAHPAAEQHDREHDQRDAEQQPERSASAPA